MKEKLMKLINVKSIVTLALTAVFAVLTIRNSIEAKDFLGVFNIIIAFYFGTQVEKRSDK